VTTPRTLFTIAISCLALGISACQGGEQPAQLSQFATCAELESAVKDLATAELRFDGRPSVSDPLCRGCEAGVGFDARGNLQMSNIAEIGSAQPDFIKSDDQHLYMVSDSALVVVSATQAEEISELSRVPIEGHAARLFVGADYVLVLSELWGDQPAPLAAEVPELLGAVVKATWVDVSDRSAPVIFRELYLEGRLNSARQVDDSFYLVTARWLRGPASEGAAVAVSGRVRDSDLNVWLPSRVDYLRGEQGWERADAYVTDCSRVFEPANAAGTVLTSVVSLDASDPTAAPGGVAVLAPAGVVNMSDEALQLGVLEQDWGPFRDRDGVLNTRLHRFDLSGGPAHPAYQRSAEVRGHVLDSFSVDEYNGYLRVATALPLRFGEQHGMYVFEPYEGGYDLVGYEEGFGVGEILTTARFDGERGFVATFEPVRMIDPLFTFDLSDPVNPRATDSLEFSGSSNFLATVGDTHLVGVGAAVDEAGWGEVIGTQVLLFNVSDMFEATEEERVVIPTSFDWTQAPWDLQAISYYPKTGTLAVPVVGSAGGEIASSMLHMFRPSAQGLGTMDVMDMSDLVVNTGDSFMDGFCSQVRRSLFLGDTVYAVTSGGLKSAALDAPGTALGTLTFQDLGNCYEEAPDGGLW
jgi:hypothetical protein